MPTSPHLPPPDPARCPLCGQANQCAMAAGQPPEDCWCMARTLPRAVLAAVPPDARGQVCICPVCGCAPEGSGARSTAPL